VSELRYRALLLWSSTKRYGILIGKIPVVVLRLLAFSCFFFAYGTAHAEDCTNCAKNRLDVLSVVGNLQSSWPEADSTVWVNNNADEPSVLVGDRIYYTMKSLVKAHFALILVDSMGHTSVLKPDAISGSSYSESSDYFVFPPLSDQCFVYEPRNECFLTNNSIVQGDTIGKETVYLLASKRPIDNDVFLVRPGTDYRSLGKDLNLIESLVNNLSGLMKQNQTDVYQYSYTVDSPDVQYTSRSIGRIVVDLEELASNTPGKEPQPETDSTADEAVVETESETIVEPIAPALVFNNIRFAYDSADITPEGRKELAALGSVLVDRLGQGKLPFVSLTGHTDSTGSAAYNLNLSGQRAKSVKRYLATEWGLPEEQIFADGAGESLPVATNDTAQGRSQNRRVEFTVISSVE